MEKAVAYILKEDEIDEVRKEIVSKFSYDITVFKDRVLTPEYTYYFVTTPYDLRGISLDYMYVSESLKGTKEVDDILRLGYDRSTYLEFVHIRDEVLPDCYIDDPFERMKLDDE